MSTSSRLPRVLVRGPKTLVLPLALLAACAEPPEQTRSEQVQYDTCNHRADEIVEQVNINALSRIDPPASPYAATSPLPNSTTDLSVEHEREDVMNDCLHHLDSSAPNTDDITATPTATQSETPITPPPSDLVGPTGGD